MEEYLVALMLQSPDPKKAFERVTAILTQFLSKERSYQKIIYHLLDYFQEYEKFDSNHFGQIIPKELLSVYNSSLLFPLPALC